LYQTKVTERGFTKFCSYYHHEDKYFEAFHNAKESQLI